MSNQRTHARRFAVQALYQWQLTDYDIQHIDDEFITEHDTSKVDIPYFRELLHGVPEHLHELDEQFVPMLDRPLEEVDPVELAILRIGCFELMFKLEVPYRVVINEAVELAKRFGAEESYKYVNSVLDKVAARLRATEVNARRNA